MSDQSNSDDQTITTVNAGGHDFSVNAKYAPNFIGFVNDLANSGYKINDIQGYNNRNIAGTSIPSYHASGAAIDINPKTNGVNGSTDLPADINDRAQKWGLGWGGAWTGGKTDPMHFSIAKQEGGSIDLPMNGKSKTQAATPAFDDLLSGKTQATPAFDDLLSGKGDSQPTNQTATPAFDQLLAETKTTTPPVTSVGTKNFGPEPPQQPSDAPDIHPGGLINQTPAPQSTGSVLSDYWSGIKQKFREGYDQAGPIVAPSLGVAIDAHTHLPIVEGANAALGAVAGGYRAAQQAIAEPFNKLGAFAGPGLGDSIAAGMDILPEALRLGPSGLGYKAKAGVGDTTPALTSTQEGKLLSPAFKSDPYASGYNPQGTIPKGATEPVYFNLDKKLEPTANPNDPATKAFSARYARELLQAPLYSGAAHLLSGGNVSASIAGAGIPFVIHLAAQYGPAVAKSVITAAQEAAKMSQLGAGPLGAIGSQTPATMTTQRPQSMGLLLGGQ